MTARFRCFACGRFTDEVKDGPTPDEVAQAERWETGILDVHSGRKDEPCRAGIACWVCFWKTDPDMWISPEHWIALNPLVPYEKLPVLDHELAYPWEPSLYPWPL